MVAVSAVAYAVTVMCMNIYSVALFFEFDLWINRGFIF